MYSFQSTTGQNIHHIILLKLSKSPNCSSLNGKPWVEQSPRCKRSGWHYAFAGLNSKLFDLNRESKNLYLYW